MSKTLLFLGKNPNLSNKKILLLEGTHQKIWELPQKYSNRVMSISPGTQKLFDLIDVWKHIINARLATVKRLQVKKYTKLSKDYM